MVILMKYKLVIESNFNSDFISEIEDCIEFIKSFKDFNNIDKIKRSKKDWGIKSILEVK